MKWASGLLLLLLTAAPACPAPEKLAGWHEVLPVKPDFPQSPPEVFRGVYLTSWSAGTTARVNRVIELARAGLVNAVVIDVKDATGYVACDTGAPEAAGCGTQRRIIRDLDSLLARLHAEGLYVIARIVVFLDPRLALARPDLAVHDQSKLVNPGCVFCPSTLWLDNRGLAWMDPAAEEVWDYNAAIAEDALRHGFDEVNFDYIRFPSDGKLRNMYFTVWTGTPPRNEVLRRFFAHLRGMLPAARLSADLFGLATVKRDELGIGQLIEDAYEYFDYVCPMVYPSHYPESFLGYENPAEHPYEVVYYSMQSARERLREAKIGGGVCARLRPWLQDFDLGAVYDARMVKAQIEAARDALEDDYSGFILWSPSNVYTIDALR